MEKFFNQLVKMTEAFLTWRARRKFIKRQKQQKKNPVLDWLDAFVWAVMVILVVNQYLFQAYEIPSESMTDTLLVHDRLFVNKLVYGPELLPGVAKVPSPIKAQRGDIIIFENPEYKAKESQGPLFDIAQRVIYMLTISLVDIDRKPNGEPKAHFLIKRAVGYGGDWLRFRNGSLEFLPSGAADFRPEAEFQKQAGLNYHVKRLVDPEFYTTLASYAKYTAFSQDKLLNLPVSEDLKQSGLKAGAAFGTTITDSQETEFQLAKVLYSVVPQMPLFTNMERYLTGTYIPVGSVLPLGDNRDNSKDGRYFGPVPLDHLLGQAAFRYWPLSRLGGLQ